MTLNFKDTSFTGSGYQTHNVWDKFYLAVNKLYSFEKREEKKLLRLENPNKIDESMVSKYLTWW